VPAVVGAGSAPSAAEAARAEHARVLAYWTPERIASAQPRDFVMNAAGRLVPTAKPGSGGGGGGGGAVTGASWSGNGAIEQRSGRILFTMGGSNWICSGSAIADGATNNGLSTVLTAGHCVYDGADGWATMWMFIPDFDDAPTYSCGSTIHGCWTATRLGANADFVTGGGFGNATVQVDYGFALVGPGGKSTSAELDQVTGSYGLKTTFTSLSDTQWAFGYPAAGKYRGRDLVYCKGSLIPDPYGSDTWGMACNMTGGSSGGPWLHGTTNPADGSGLVSSVNSYGYSGLQYMFGPKFNGETSTVQADVISGVASPGVTALRP
jgi:V8-like Glu-specific endopeptidase